jgi:hypothetical protein
MTNRSFLADRGQQRGNAAEAVLRLQAVDRVVSNELLDDGGFT